MVVAHSNTQPLQRGPKPGHQWFYALKDNIRGTSQEDIEMKFGRSIARAYMYGLSGERKDEFCEGGACYAAWQAGETARKRADIRRTLEAVF